MPVGFLFFYKCAVIILSGVPFVKKTFVTLKFYHGTPCTGFSCSFPPFSLPDTWRTPSIQRPVSFCNSPWSVLDLVHCAPFFPIPTFSTSLSFQPAFWETLPGIYFQGLCCIFKIFAVIFLVSNRSNLFSDASFLIASCS